MKNDWAYKAGFIWRLGFVSEKYIFVTSVYVTENEVTRRGATKP